MLRLLFLDQSGKPGGAELCLLDTAEPYRDGSLVGLFADGPFRTLLEQYQIPVQVLSEQALQVRKESGWVQGLLSLGQLAPLIARVVHLSRSYDLIYANTQKALVVGAIASLFSRRPLVYHLHDIISPDHFSATNRRLIVTLANRCAAGVIANSKASEMAFMQAGGRPRCLEVIYNGFDTQRYGDCRQQRDRIRDELGVRDRFVVGQFSRLSPWKGQHVLIEALVHCPETVTALLVGEALFGEEDYAAQLHQQVTQLGLQDRVQFLGFRSDVPDLMAACDLVAHTSTAPEPFGRVIVEAMLCGTPVVAAAAGGAVELIEPEQTGWLSPPGNSQTLAHIIRTCQKQPEQACAIADQAALQATQRFDIKPIQQQIDRFLRRVLEY